MAPDAEAIRTLTRHYPSLRGYQQLPFAAVMVVLSGSELMGWRRAGDLTAVIPLLLLALVGSAAVGRFYTRRFGRVEVYDMTSGQGCFLVLVGYLVFATLQGVSILAKLPVWLGFLAVGIGIAATAFHHRWMYIQRLLPAIAIILMSFALPVERNAPEATFQALVLLCCVVWGVMAVMDHRALVRAFERAGLKG